MGGQSVSLLQTVGFLTFFLGLTTIFAHLGDVTQSMSNQEREQLRDEAKDMFYHAYRAYMENAYPADELMPLSCAGRYRGSGVSRGDIDDSLGNFSLTLIDSLDTLVVLGDLEEFEHAVKLVIRDVTFESDIVVSVFETNIRVLGGLLSGHVLAEYLQQRAGIMSWYRGDLLNMARDLGYRLLLAFNTTTGIPHARVNLMYGMKSPSLESSRETCTACAGTMILEMAALSRLTGEPIFEEKAHRAMDELWRLRHRSSDLMGTVLNIHSGDWVRRDSGVGAGIDSYYEYCLKAYILLGDERYLGRFNKHYSAVMKYISQGPMLLDVHMHRPHTNSRNFMDALLAFWPGLQVLKGDIKPAVETHEMLYQVIQRHNFIPEAFTTDFQVHWGQHPLRPEFLESTYFLYRATADPYYLQAGRSVLRALQKHARVPCGYAAVKDVRTGVHEDRMDSFVLAETFKYLYLLFADPSDLVIDLDEFLFTTEAHLLPLALSRNSNSSVVTVYDPVEQDWHNTGDIEEYARTCPNTLHLFPESVRRPLRNMVSGVCPKKFVKRKLTATQFLAGNTQHMQLVKDMGISILTLPDGRVQLMHTFANALSASDGEEGIQFMQEMVELSKAQAQSPDAPPRAIWFRSRAPGGQDEPILIKAGPAHFGTQLDNSLKVSGRVGVAEPLRACQDLTNPERLVGRVVIIERGDCMFVDKARRLQKAGAVGGIVVDNTPGTAANTSPMFAMSGDGTDDVTIPVVFLFYLDATKLLQAVGLNPAMHVTLGDLATLQKGTAHAGEQLTGDLSTEKTLIDKKKQESTLERLKDSILEFLNKKDKTPTEFTQLWKTVDPGTVHKGLIKDDVVSKSHERKESVAAVEPGAAGAEVIRISRKSSAEPDDRWVRLRQTLLTKLSHGDVQVPAAVLKVYHQLLEDIGSKNDERSTQLQAAWLLAELAKLEPQDECDASDPSDCKTDEHETDAKDEL